MAIGPLLAAILVGVIVYLLSASVLFGVLAFVVVLLLVGGGVYSRRW